jgi:hypothetical protein
MKPSEKRLSGYAQLENVWQPDVKPINPMGQTPERAAQYAEEVDNLKYVKDLGLLDTPTQRPYEDPNDPTTEAGYRALMLTKRMDAANLKAPEMEKDSKIMQYGGPALALAIAALSKAPNNAALETMKLHQDVMDKKLQQYNREMDKYSEQKADADKTLEGAYKSALGNKLTRTQLAGEELGQKKTAADMAFDEKLNPLRLEGAQTTIDKSKADQATEAEKKVRLKAYQERMKKIAEEGLTGKPLEDKIQSLGAEAAAYEDPTKLYTPPKDDFNIFQTRGEDELAKIGNGLASDPIIKKKREVLDAANYVEAALAKQNPVMDEALKTQMARMAGEVGAMSNQDIARFSGSADFRNQLNRLVSKVTTGKMTAEDRAWMMEIAKTSKNMAAAMLDKTLDKMSKKYISIYGADPAKVADIANAYRSDLPRYFDTYEEAVAGGMTVGDRVNIAGQTGTMKE